VREHRAFCIAALTLVPNGDGFAHRLLRRGHDRVADATVQGLHGHLGDEFA
jgi:hypothetical protein